MNSIAFVTGSTSVCLSSDSDFALIGSESVEIGYVTIVIGSKYFLTTLL